MVKKGLWSQNWVQISYVTVGNLLALAFIIYKTGMIESTSCSHYKIDTMLHTLFITVLDTNKHTIYDC